MMSWRAFFAFVLLVGGLSACDVLLEPVSPASPGQPVTGSPLSAAGGTELVGEIPVQVGYAYRGPFYEVYFTDPLNENAWMQEGGPDEPLVAAIDTALLSVDVAIYSLSLESVRDALVRSHERGVVVRMVMESDNLDRTVPQRLLSLGIPIYGDGRESLMHDKFVIIDRREVWLGSMNFTASGTYEDNNHMMVVRSPEIVDNYLTEFDEMFEKGYFGEDIVPKTPNPTVTVDGIALENYFSPDDGVGRRIATLLNGAEESIYFMAYSFTLDDFSEILLDKAADGLKIRGVMETDQVKSNTGGEFATFEKAGLNVLMDGNPGQMHHKVWIIDRKIVITGSYNFSASAERRNDENVIIFYDPALAEQFLAEFERVFEQAAR